MRIETSPDSSVRAVVFRRSCGATTGFSTEVSVIGPNEPLPTGDVIGNVFAVGDTSRHRAEISFEDVLSLNVEWMSPRVLQITHSARADVFRQQHERGGVRILYRKRP